MANNARKGFKDPRGTVFDECVRYIAAAMPNAFILENVRDLLSIDGGSAFAYVLSQLRSVVEPRFYHV